MIQYGTYARLHTFLKKPARDINVLPNTTCLGGIKMFKVVICDDERIIRQGLKQMIPWKNIILQLFTLPQTA